MKVQFWSVAMALAGVVLSGCATVSARYVPPESRTTMSGIPFHSGLPYLMVSEIEAKADNGAVTTRQEAKVIYLPDPCGEYRLHARAFLSKVEFDFGLADGWRLEKAAGSMDSQDVASTVVEQLGAIVAGAAKLTGNDAPPVTAALSKVLVYPIFKRQNEDCSKPLVLAENAFIKSAAATTVTGGQ